MIDTSDNSKDIESRVGAVIQVGDEILIGHAPNRKMGPNSWDLVGKGHRTSGSSPEEDVIREVKEESNITVTERDLWRLGVAKYQTGTITFFLVNLPEKPKDIKCISTFTMYGKDWPEIKEFKWVKIEESLQYLYKGLGKAFEPFIELIKELELE